MAKKESEKVKTIKFTEEEIKGLNDLANTYRGVETELGAIEVRRLILNQQLDALDRRKVELETAYTTNQQTERDLSKSLTEKYGPGNLNPETGEFTPLVEEN